MGKKNFNEFARMIGLNIADELEDNFENSLLQGLIAHDAVVGSNLGPRSPGSLINLLLLCLFLGQGSGNKIYTFNNFFFKNNFMFSKLRSLMRIFITLLFSINFKISK